MEDIVAGLESAGIPPTRRMRRGRGVLGACGQLGEILAASDKPSVQGHDTPAGVGLAFRLDSPYAPLRDAVAESSSLRGQRLRLGRRLPGPSGVLYGAEVDEHVEHGALRAGRRQERSHARVRDGVAVAQGCRDFGGSRRFQAGLRGFQRHRVAAR